MFDTQTIITWIMMGLSIAGIGLSIGFLGFNPSNKENASQVRANLSIMAAVIGAIILIFGGAAYMYFSANVNYLTPFLLIMTFVNLFLSLFATSAASLQITTA